MVKLGKVSNLRTDKMGHASYLQFSVMVEAMSLTVTGQMGLRCQGS